VPVEDDLSMKRIVRQASVQRLILVSATIATYAALVLIVARSHGLPQHTFYYWDPLTEGLIMQLDLYPPTLEFPREVVLEIDDLHYIYREVPQKPTPTEVCIDRITVSQASGGDFAVTFIPFLDVEFPLCFKCKTPFKRPSISDQIVLLEPMDPGAIPTLRTTLDVVPPVGTWDPTWYPYDSFSLELVLEVDARLLHDGQTLVSQVYYPLNRIHIRDMANWEVISSLEPASGTLIGRTELLDSESVVSLAFARPLFTQILLPSIVGVVVAFVLLLCFVEDLTPFIEGAVAVFFGIFGLSQVLLPESAETATVAHYAVWGLYFAFAGLIVYHLASSLVRTLRSRKSDTTEPNSEHHDLATPVVQTDPLGEPPESLTSSSTDPPQLEPASHPPPSSTQKAAGLLLLGATVSFIGWILIKATRPDKPTL